jgi:hypothetical protein
MAPNLAQANPLSNSLRLVHQGAHNPGIADAGDSERSSLVRITRLWESLHIPRWCQPVSNRLQPECSFYPSCSFEKLVFRSYDQPEKTRASGGLTYGGTLLMRWNSRLVSSCDFFVQFWRTREGPDQFADAMRDAERLRDRPRVEQAKSAGRCDHRALGKFLGVTS